jgi:NADH-quinone oxidoreductase subunit A
MWFNFAVIGCFLIVGLLFVLAVLIFGKIIRPLFPSKQKSQIYECGERPIYRAWFNFNPRFYIIALIFLIFEVEIAFIFPVAIVYRKWVDSGWGVLALIEIAIFVVILFIGLVYCWGKGDLNWIKQLRE